VSVQRIIEIANKPVKIWQLALGLIVCSAVTYAANSAVSRAEVIDVMDDRDADIMDMLREIHDMLDGLSVPVSQTNHVEVSRTMSDAELRDARMRAREGMPSISYGKQ